MGANIPTMDATSAHARLNANPVGRCRGGASRDEESEYATNADGRRRKIGGGDERKKTKKKERTRGFGFSYISSVTNCSRLYMFQATIRHSV